MTAGGQVWRSGITGEVSMHDTDINQMSWRQLERREDGAAVTMTADNLIMILKK